MRKLKRVGRHEWRFDWPRPFQDACDAIDDAVEQFYAGKHSAAERGLRAVLERFPEHLDAMWHLAGFLKRRGQRAEAAKMWKDAVELGRTAFPPRTFQFGRDLLEWAWLENRPFLRCLDSLDGCAAGSRCARGRPELRAGTARAESRG